MQLKAGLEASSNSMLIENKYAQHKNTAYIHLEVRNKSFFPDSVTAGIPLFYGALRIYHHNAAHLSASTVQSKNALSSV